MPEGVERVQCGEGGTTLKTLTEFVSQLLIQRLRFAAVRAAIELAKAKQKERDEFRHKAVTPRMPFKFDSPHDKT